MSTRRIIGITVFGVLFIAIVVSAMLLFTYFERGNEPIPLPVTTQTTSDTPPVINVPDTQDHVEVTRDSLREVVSTLFRPDTYSREILVVTFWEGGRAEYRIKTDVTENVTSLHIRPPTGGEKRIIVTPDTLYIWYTGDVSVYSGAIGSAGDEYRTADEWQMLAHYEELYDLDPNDIIGTGYVVYNGEDCIYAEYLSPLLGYTKKYYVSIDYGLIAGAEEYDETGKLVYVMTAGDCVIGVVDPTAFILPGGIVLVDLLH